jgi:hypothetical protein
MRKATLLVLSLLMVAGAIVTSGPAVEAAGGSTPGTPGCHWDCSCTGSPFCYCPPGVNGHCPYPINIGCAQVITC